jgi:hypothetical protein
MFSSFPPFSVGLWAFLHSVRGRKSHERFEASVVLVFPTSVTWPVSISSELLSLGYHIIVTNNIHVNIMVRRLEGNIGKCNGGGSVTARGRCREGLSVGLLSVASM